MRAPNKPPKRLAPTHRYYESCHSEEIDRVTPNEVLLVILNGTKNVILNGAKRSEESNNPTPSPRDQIPRFARNDNPMETTSLLLKQMSARRAERDAGDPLLGLPRIYSDIVKQHSALRFDVQP